LDHIKKESTMNNTGATIALALAGTLIPAAVWAQSSSIDVASGPSSIASTVVIAIAALDPGSLRTMPGYPLQAYRDGYRTGSVAIGYKVGPDGTVSDVNVVQATPGPAFTRVARNAVSGWRFIPDGSVQSRMVQFDFRAE